MKGKYHIHRVVALMAWPFNDINDDINDDIIFKKKQNKSGSCICVLYW